VERRLDAGIYDGETDNPDFANAFSSTMSELGMLMKHETLDVKVFALHIADLPKNHHDGSAERLPPRFNEPYTTLLKTYAVEESKRSKKGADLRISEIALEEAMLRIGFEAN
jgi:hypothetical protein